MIRVVIDYGENTAHGLVGPCNFASGLAEWQMDFFCRPIGDHRMEFVILNRGCLREDSTIRDWWEVEFGKLEIQPEFLEISDDPKS